MSAGSLLKSAVFALAAGTVPAGAMLAPRPGRPVAILHRSDDAALVAAAVAAAGGSLLATSGAHVTVARSEIDGFAARMQMSGPWLVLDDAMLRDCSAALRRAQTPETTTFPPTSPN